MTSAAGDRAMKVMISGGTGFLGQAVARRLLDRGDAVVLYDLAPLRSPDLEGRVTYVRGDVTDGIALARSAKEQEIEVLVHLAAILATESDANPGLAVRVSVGGMVNALETGRILGLKRVVWASSASVFGGYRDGRAIANDAPYVPINVYGATKVMNERLAARYTEGFGLDTIGFRFTLMTGAGKADGVSGSIGRELIEKPVRGEPGAVPFGDDTASWLWVDDAAEAVAIAVHHEGLTQSRAFNIAGETRSLRDAADLVRGLVPGARLTLQPGTANLYHLMDTSALERELGFVPRTSLEQQLRLMIEQARREVGASTTAR